MKTHAEVFHETSASALEGHRFPVYTVSYMPDMYGCLRYARVFQTSVDRYGDALGCLEHLKCLCLDNEASPWSMEARE